MDPSHLATLKEVLTSEPPDHLFHYTSPHGLIGIVSSKELWATSIRYLNDEKELEHGISLVELNLDNFLYRNEGTEEVNTLVKQMLAGVRAANHQIHIFSLSEADDLLSQWRAYCPQEGGYALGLPSKQLAVMARKQRFLLAPCIYDDQTQGQISNEIIYYFIRAIQLGIPHNCDNLEEHRKNMIRHFAQEVAKYAPLLKHGSFSEEREWRLISPPLSMNEPQISFRPGRSTVIPYYRFALTDPENPSLVTPGNMKNSLGVVVGPTSNLGASQLAVQALLYKNLGQGAWHGRTDTPYRTW